jgi:hypothetical protein
MTYGPIAQVIASGGIKGSRHTISNLLRRQPQIPWAECDLVRDRSIEELSGRVLKDQTSLRCQIRYGATCRIQARDGDFP